MPPTKTFTIDPATTLTAQAVLNIANSEQILTLSPDARSRVASTREALLATIATGEIYYGVNTGFGSLSRQQIEGDALANLQTNLLRSHAAGVGAPLPIPAVRAMLTLLAASLARAHSGVRPIVIEHICALLNHQITPVVPELGSVGASGDLAPLAHAALVLLGEGEAFTKDGSRKPGAAALNEAGIHPIQLEAKEGLALINGTHLMAARFTLLLAQLDTLTDAATTAAAMSIDACRATDSTLDPRVYALRNQPGPKATAAAIRARLAGSQILADHRANDPRVQDPYSFRCAPIVLGSAIDCINHARTHLEAELQAVTDNPLVFPHDDQTFPTADIISAGNFHGMPLAIPLDTLAIAVSHIAGIAERRVYHMLSVFDQETHLNPYLSPQPGLHSGLMIAQYTAAALCNEIIGLATPASPINISTSAGMEDYNSFGPRAAAKAKRAADLATKVIAIELLCAAQAIDAHRPLSSGNAIEHAHATIRAAVPTLTQDRPPAPDIEAIAELISSGQLKAD